MQVLSQIVILVRLVTCYNTTDLTETDTDISDYSLLGPGDNITELTEETSDDGDDSFKAPIDTGRRKGIFFYFQRQ